MKRTMSRPIILTLPTYEMHAVEMKPRILPFPRLGLNSRKASKRPRSVEASRDLGDADLGEIRDRLFRMIVSNEWDRSHEHRAS